MPSLPFQLRPLVLADAPSIAHHINDIDVLNNLRDYIPNPYTEADAIAFIKLRSVPDDAEYANAIVIDGKAVGVIGLRAMSDVYCKTAELGYWLGKSYWGKGIMTDVVKAFVEQSWQRSEFVKIFATTFESNPASRRVLTKAGFEHEATTKFSVYKNGVYMDQYHFYKLLPGFPGKNDTVFAG